MTLYGDSELFSFFPIDVTRERYQEVDSWYGRIWDMYPFPDTTMNPGRGGPPSAINVAMSPSYEDINRCLNRFVIFGLTDGEKWLLSIPRRVERLGVIDAQALFSKAGGVAVRYPKAAITNLFLVNELLLELRLRENSNLDEKQRLRASQEMSNLLGAWLTTQDINDLDFCGEVSEALSNIRYIRRFINEYGRFQVWSATATQQVFLLLHELGHIADYQQRQTTPVSPLVSKLTTPNLEEEKRADAWAIRALLQAFKKWFPGNPLWVRRPLLDIFGVLTILCNKGFLPGDGAVYAERWNNLDSIIQSGVISKDYQTLDALEKKGPYWKLVPINKPKKLVEFDSKTNGKNHKATYKAVELDCHHVLDILESLITKAIHFVQSSNEEHIYSGLADLGNSGWERYCKKRASGNSGGELDNDLLNSIAAFEAIARNCPFKNNDPIEAKINEQLCVELREAFTVSKDKCYLELSVARGKRAVSLAETPTPLQLFNLAVSLWARYDEYSGGSWAHNQSQQAEADISEALNALKRALELTPVNSPYRETFFKNLQTLAIRDRAGGFQALYNLSCTCPDITMQEGHLALLTSLETEDNGGLSKIRNIGLAYTQLTVRLFWKLVRRFGSLIF